MLDSFSKIISLSIGRKASTYTLVCIRLFIYCVCSSLFWLLIIVKVGGSSSNAYSHIFLIMFSYSSPSVKNNNSCCTYPGGLSMKKYIYVNLTYVMYIVLKLPSWNEKFLFLPSCSIKVSKYKSMCNWIIQWTINSHLYFKPVSIH